MGHNQVIIIEKPTYIRIKDCCLLFEQQRQVVAKVLPEDIDCLILHYTTTITAKALADLATFRVTVVLLDKHQLPLAYWYPPKSTSNQKQRLKNLIALSDSMLGGRLWQRVIQAKISSQINTLKLLSCNANKHLNALIKKVKIGDETNIEAQAARVYWVSLFSDKFRRQKRGTDEPINQHLNFGYGVLRSLLAKWLTGRGIALEWGFHHQNKDNLFCLVDDLIEPFRFIVDRAIASNLEIFNKEISAKSKKVLLAEIYKPIEINGKNFRLANAIDVCCSSFSRILDKPSKATKNWLIIPYT